MFWQHEKCTDHNSIIHYVCGHIPKLIGFKEKKKVRKEKKKKLLYTNQKQNTAWNKLKTCKAVSYKNGEDPSIHNTPQ